MKAVIAFLELTQSVLFLAMQLVLFTFAGFVALIGALIWKK